MRRRSYKLPKAAPLSTQLSKRRTDSKPNDYLMNLLRAQTSKQEIIKSESKKTIVFLRKNSQTKLAGGLKTVTQKPWCMAKSITSSHYGLVLMAKIDRNFISWQGVRTLPTRHRWMNLSNLMLESDKLGQNNISDLGCRWLTRINMPHLSELYFRLNGIGIAGLRHLSKCSLPELQILTLDQNMFDHSCSRQLNAMSSPLRNHSLGECSLTIQSLAHLTLAQYPIEKLLVGNNMLSVKCKQRLEVVLSEKYPQAWIIW